MQKVKIYLDDTRTIIREPGDNWIVVRNANDFMRTIEEIGFENIELASLDHDLGELSISEYYNNKMNFTIDYTNIAPELTGYDCAKYLVEKWMDGESVFDVVVHSANPVGAANIMGLINAFRKYRKLEQNCIRVQWAHINSYTKSDLT